MKRAFPLLMLLLVLICLCESVSGYLTASEAISWSFTVKPLSYSISDAELIPTGQGYTIIVTFAPIPGPTSINLSIP